MADNDTTYVDVLQGAGFIPGYPGMHSHGTRIIRNKADGEIVEVLPPPSIQITGTDISGNIVSETLDAPVGNETVLSTNRYASLTNPAEEPLQEESQKTQDDNPIQVHVATIDIQDDEAPPPKAEPPAQEEAPSQSIAHEEAKPAEQEAPQEPIAHPESEAAQ